ncbi:hypothetical protein [Fibrella aquatilis]|uniref:Outer membrane protein beta-barrel domain-containing protein n=1 Tax=Fibrella aquatilis TaxID=2817059 RepID=A0A939JX45_9BACT|nr:hypothetical protein [Fibrella aquatilis]MBO0932572.1 hypothetical protein [Fibrella aquatilis]
MRSVYTLLWASLGSLWLTVGSAQAQTAPQAAPTRTRSSVGAATTGNAATRRAKSPVPPKATAEASEDDEYQTVTTFGITTNTNAGLLGGLVFRQSRRMDTDLFGKPQYRYLSLEVVNVRSPREYSPQNNFGGSSITPGKENYLFVVRPQYGRELALFRRNADEGISVNAIFAVGPSLGIIKPYYVEVSSGNTTRQVPYAQAYSSAENIVGSGSFFKGLGESTLTVGIHAKAALSFELSAFRNNTTGVEIGFLAEMFPKTIIIIPNLDPTAGGREVGNRNFFTSGYVTLFFGSKK